MSGAPEFNTEVASLTVVVTKLVDNCSIYSFILKAPFSFVLKMVCENYAIWGGHVSRTWWLLFLFSSGRDRRDSFHWQSNFKTGNKVVTSVLFSV